MSKKINVSINDFTKKFREEYAFLYDHYDNVAGYEEARDMFDDLVQHNDSFKAFVAQFCVHIQDFISSDREAAAFMFALEALNAI